ATTWVVIADTLCLGVVSAFSAPAQQALIVSLVRRDEVPTAVALNSMTFNLARALGPAAAALSVHYLGIPASFALNSLSYAIIVGAFGAGAVTAALVVAGRVTGSRGRMAATLFLLGGGVAAFSVCPWLPLGFVLLFVGGFGYLASNTAATTRLQLGVAERQRG